MQSICYAISIVLLFVLYILKEKKKEKINIFKCLGIALSLLFGYNCLLCHVLNVINIPINLINLSICNLIVSFALLFNIIKNKKIQKYNVKIQDLIAITIILLICIFSSCLNFGNKINIKYVMTDAAVHFNAAKEFYENDKLLNKTENTTTSKDFLTASYTNMGILFKAMDPIIEKVDLSKLFIIFDIFVFTLLGLMLYFAIEKVIKSNISFVLTMICIGLCIIGYPLNSLIYGYVYLHMGLLLILTIITYFSEFECKFDSKMSIIELLILNFGVFLSYCIFIPIVYSAEGIMLLICQYKENKKIINKRVIIQILLCLVVPFILGLIYCVIPHLIINSNSAKFIDMDGYIYRNFFSNFIFIVPISILCFKNKNKDTQFLFLLAILTLIIMIVFITFIAIGDRPTYYYFKYNFLLWLLLWYGVLYSINTFSDNKKIVNIMSIYIGVYITILIGTLLFQNVPIEKDKWGKKESILNAFDIYGTNKTVITKIYEDFNQEEIELLKYINKNLNIKDNKILIIGSDRQELWFYGLLNYKNRDNMQDLLPKQEIISWNKGEKYKYAIVFNKLSTSEVYNLYIKNLSKKKIVFENESGIIYENVD